MLKLVIILSPTEPFLSFREAIAKLGKEYPGSVKADLFSTSELDDSQEAYASCELAFENADFIFMYILARSFSSNLFTNTLILSKAEKGSILKQLLKKRMLSCLISAILCPRTIARYIGTTGQAALKITKICLSGLQTNSAA